MICAACGEPATVSRKYEDFCQFHWESLQHEIQIQRDAIRDLGPYNKFVGPTFGVTYYGWLKGDKEHGPQYAGPGFSTLGFGLHLSRTPQQAMEEATRIAKRNDWKLLRLDVQANAPRIYVHICTNIFVSYEYTKYMAYSRLEPLAYDADKYGPRSAA